MLLHHVTVFSALTSITHVHWFISSGWYPYRIHHTSSLSLAD